MESGSGEGAGRLKKSRFTEDQIGMILNQQEPGLAVAGMPDVKRRELVDALQDFELASGSDRCRNGRS
jgi:hypothetical protein